MLRYVSLELIEIMHRLQILPDKGDITINNIINGNDLV